MQFSSKLIERAVQSFASLPGVGKKTALRLVLHMINQDHEYTQEFVSSLKMLREQIKECTVCHNYSDHEICEICNDRSRNHQLICLVESIRDVMAIEDTNQFSGVYHVLGGIISPIDGVGPQDLHIDSLLNRVEQQSIDEVIMAINPSIEGETTIYYLSKKLQEKDVKVSTLARGVAFGAELEYADEMTIARSIQSRLPYQLFDK